MEHTTAASPNTDIFSQEIERFTRNINSLDGLIGPVMFIVSGAVESAADRFTDYANRYGQEIESTEEDKRFKFDPPYANKAQSLNRQLSERSLGSQLIPRTFLVALVSQFDSFLGQIVKRLLLLRPELVNSSEKPLTLAQLLSLGSLESATEFILEKEVETLLRNSHAEQFKWLENRFKIPLSKDLAVWPTFIELTERRNLFVHADGIVSDQYLAVCREHAPESLSGVHKGQQLEVDPTYFNRSMSCVYEIGVKLAQVLWRKQFPNDLEKADNSLTGVAFELLSQGRFDLATRILDFACDTLKKFSSDVARRMFIVNRAQAFKWQGNDEKCRVILRREDWSACRDDFQLAVAVLEDRYVDAAALMKQIGPNGLAKESYYHDWPLFREFVKSPEFQQAYNFIYGKPFVHLDEVVSAQQRRDLKRKVEDLLKEWGGDGSEEAEPSEAPPVTIEKDDIPN